MLSKITIERLTILADFMEGLDAPEFDMKIIRHVCGAPACAFGFARHVPALRAVGLTETASLYDAVFTPNGFFEGASYLFVPQRAGDLQTPQQWAAHCRKWLAENGAELPSQAAQDKPETAPATQLTQPDPFAAFMQSVLAPVEVEHE